MTAKIDVLEVGTETFMTKSGQRESHFLLGRDQDRRWTGPAVRFQLANAHELERAKQFEGKLIDATVTNIKEDWKGDLTGTLVLPAVAAAGGKAS